MPTSTIYGNALEIFLERCRYSNLFRQKRFANCPLQSARIQCADYFQLSACTRKMRSIIGQMHYIPCAVCILFHGVACSVFLKYIILYVLYILWYKAFCRFMAYALSKIYRTARLSKLHTQIDGLQIIN
jgi:hypothetical protein